MKQADKEIIGVLNQIKAGGGGGAGGTWGSITGTLASQGDLSTALGTKLSKASNLSDVSSALTALQNLTAKGADIASASTTDLSTATGSFINVTGTTTINGFGTVAAGSKFLIKFTGAGTITYNATSLILPGSASITRASGDVGGFESLGSGNWQCLFYYKADGTAVVGSGGSVSDTAFANTWDGITTVAPSKNTLWDAVGVGWNYPLSVYAAGTAYSLTATPAAMTFGTTNPVLVLDKSGTYKIEGRAYAQYNGATYASNQTATVKLRRTNNTAADIANATTTAKLRVITTITDTVGVMPLPPVTYTTTNANDSITIFGSVSSTPAAGSVDISEASIFATLLYGAPASPTYLVNQNFDTASTGYDNGEAWTPTITSPHGFSLDTSTPIKGTQSLVFISGTGGQQIDLDFTPGTDRWAFAYFTIPVLPSASVTYPILLQDSPVTVSLAGVQIDSSGALTFICNGTSSASALTIVAGTPYAAWIHFVSSGTCEMYVVAAGGTIPNPTATKPPTSDTSGHAYKTATGISASAGHVSILKASSNTTGTMEVDRILVSASSIGDNP